MALPNIFSSEVSLGVIDRINQLEATTPAKWGTMTVDQMLAHCNVSYEMVYETNPPQPNAFFKFILKTLVKNKVVSEKPFDQSVRTAPQFIIKDRKDFNAEKQRLIDYVSKTQQLGEQHFDGLESHSFGKLNKAEWNNLFYKHIDHHLKQFGV